MYDFIKKEISQEYYKKNFANEGQCFVVWYLRNIYNLDEIQAKDCLTDGADDKKIDAVFIDDDNSIIHIIQGKFYSGSINGEPVQECNALFSNLKDLNALQVNGNDLIKRKVSEISTALEDEYKISIELITTGNLTNSALVDFNLYKQQISEQDELPAELILIDNDTLKIKYDDALNKVTPYINQKFNLEKGKFLELNLDGTKAVIAALPLKECYRIRGILDGSLFRKNVRQSLGLNRINKGIAQTIRNNPEDFFFYHNGITAVCSTFSIENETLDIKGLNVVNGCQSLTSIANCSESIKQKGKGYILFRFYEIGDDNEGAAKGDKISTFTNSQSAVKARDLRSNDKVVLAIQKSYNQRYPDGFFLTKRGEVAPKDKTNKNHIITLTDLGKWIVAWHSQRPTISYSETKLFDKYFTQLFRKDYDPEDIQALKEMYDAVMTKWTKENPLDLNDSLLAMKAYAPYHHLYAISLFFCVINQVPESVISPKLALKKLKDYQLLDDVVSMAGNCLNTALTNANEEYIQNKKVFSPQNWIKQKGSLKGVRESINSTLNMLKIVPQGKETYDKLKIGLQVDSASFEERWTAE
ncbi:MAG: AIPR family protein [Spirochaetia bacterium]|nr:AIPR family protein [Spirochaetia bacterium]